MIFTQKKIFFALFQSDECFLTVPLSIIITTDTVQATPSLGTLINHDQLLRSMPNIGLALFLLHERLQSKWKPYIDVLPNDFSTPLYFDSDQLNRLKPSAALCMKKFSLFLFKVSVEKYFLFR